MFCTLNYVRGIFKTSANEIKGYFYQYSPLIICVFELLHVFFIFQIEEIIQILSSFSLA
jgi:hypothetical protein